MSEVVSQVVEGLRAGLLLTDAEGRVLFHNERAATLFGRKMTGSHLSTDSFDDDIPLVAQVAEVYRRACGEGDSGELLAATDETGSHYYWVMVAPAGGAAAGKGRRVVAVVDISAPVTEAPAIRKVFSQVNHDLRSPLTSIAGAAELLLSGRVGGLEPVQRRLVTIVEEGCRKMADLLAKTKADLLKAEAGGQSGE